MANKKIKHDHVCDECGAPATINIQDSWHKYAITPSGDFKPEDEWEGNTNEFYCDEHANQEKPFNH